MNKNVFEMQERLGIFKSMENSVGLLKLIVTLHTMIRKLFSVGSCYLCMATSFHLCQIKKNYMRKVGDFSKNIYLDPTYLVSNERQTFILSSDKVNSFPNKSWFLRVCSGSLLKTLWEKEKLLVTSNFSFSHSVFCLF